MKAIHRQLARGVWRAGRIYPIIVFAMVASLHSKDVMANGPAKVYVTNFKDNTVSVIDSAAAGIFYGARLSIRADGTSINELSNDDRR